MLMMTTRRSRSPLPNIIKHCETFDDGHLGYETFGRALSIIIRRGRERGVG